MPHGWLGTIQLISRFLSLLETLRRHYYQVEFKKFPVESNKNELVELFSLMPLVGDIITMAQCSSHPALIDVFQALCMLRKKILNPSEPLPIYDPTDPNYK